MAYLAAIAIGTSGLKTILMTEDGNITAEFADISAVGLSGQMHSVVLLDHQGQVIRPCITWRDTRAKENEPENYDDTVVFMMVKDYIRYRLTGEIGTETTDASGTMAPGI